MSLAVSAAPGFDKAIVQGQVMSDAVAPAWSTTSEVRIVVKYPLVDVAEDQLAILGTEDCHCYDADVAVVRLRLFVRCGV